MYFFISGEVAKEAGNGYGPLATSLEKKINECIKGNDYGSVLKKIGIIPTIFDLQTYVGLPYQERKLLKRKKGEADYRLAINYDNFVSTDDAGKERLLVENIIESIRDIGKKLKKEEFDAEKLETDVLVATGYSS
jgi:hypothetical protein